MQDALDIPYPLMENIALRMTSSVMTEALGNLQELDSDVHLQSLHQVSTLKHRRRATKRGGSGAHTTDIKVQSDGKHT